MADQRDPCFAFRYSGSHASAYSVDAVITRKHWSGSTEKDLLKELVFPCKVALLLCSSLLHILDRMVISIGQSSLMVAFTCVSVSSHQMVYHNMTSEDNRVDENDRNVSQNASVMPYLIR